MEMNSRPPFVFLETAAFDKENRSSFLFTDFSEILIFNSRDDPEKFFQKAEGFLKKGFWLCGYFAYEFGYFLEPALYHLKREYKFPLAWLGVCREPAVAAAGRRLPLPGGDPRGYTVKGIKAKISRAGYGSRIGEIKEYLRQGLTYQVNFTFKMKFDFSGDPAGLYANLRQAQPTSYLAMINTGDTQVLSFSPELFFRMENGRILTRPMKGTAGRGLGQSGDEKSRGWLGRDKKTRSENVMIVDLLRNDLGRISRDVRVSELFKIEKYRTLYQLTSTVESELKQGVGLKDIFYALFPSGSVTGAPKIKTMELIRRLEDEPRGAYTGAVGYIKSGQACFNVAIRTIVVRGKQGEMGVGGGIVEGSSPDAEFAEAMLKSQFLRKKFADFSLVESLLWKKEGGYFLFGLHLARLRKSCAYFSVPLDIQLLKNKLTALGKTLGDADFKVRAAVNLEGGIALENVPLKGVNTPVKIKVSSRRTDPADIFLYHKTSQRALYDREKKRAEEEGFFDVIFLNKSGQITEGAMTNIFFKKHGRLYTPAVSSGLLKGVLRERLLQKRGLSEGIFYLPDLREADKVYVGNSVRGLLEAEVGC